MPRVQCLVTHFRKCLLNVAILDPVEIRASRERIADIDFQRLLRTEGLPEALKVDVGDALAGSADFDRIEYRYIQQAFAKMGYEALNAGHRESQLSAGQL